MSQQCWKAQRNWVQGQAPMSQIARRQAPTAQHCREAQRTCCAGADRMLLVDCSTARCAREAPPDWGWVMPKGEAVWLAVGMVDPKPSPEELASVVGRPARLCMAGNRSARRSCRGLGGCVAMCTAQDGIVTAAAVTYRDEAWVECQASTGRWRQHRH